MREEHPPAQEYMRAVSGEFLETVKEFGINPSRSKLINKFVVVNG